MPTIWCHLSTRFLCDVLLHRFRDLSTDIFMAGYRRAVFAPSPPFPARPPRHQGGTEILLYRSGQLLFFEMDTYPNLT